MARFLSYIPPDLLANGNTEKFCKVLDLLHLEKNNEVDKFNRLFDHRLNTNVNFLRKFVVELTGWNLPLGMPKKILENILYNAEDLFEFKGTLRGLKLLFNVLTDGDSLINISNYLPTADYIILNDFKNGYLPNDDDFNILAGNTEGTFNYLFEEDMSASLGTIDIRVISPYSHVKELRDFMEKIILDFIPFGDKSTLTISIRYYNYLPISNNRIKNFIYGN